MRVPLIILGISVAAMTLVYVAASAMRGNGGPSPTKPPPRTTEPKETPKPLPAVQDPTMPDPPKPAQTDPKRPDRVATILAQKDPQEIATLLEKLAKGELALTEAEVAKLRALLGGAGTPEEQVLAAELLTLVPDPDGKALQLLKQATASTHEMVTLTALVGLRRYVERHPGSLRDVNGFLLGYAASAGALEMKAVALSSVEFDLLAGGEIPTFERFFSDGSEEIRLAAIDAAGRAGQRRVEAIGSLARAYRSEPTLDLREMILDTILSRGGPEAASALEGLRGVEPELDDIIESALKKLREKP